MSGGLLAPNRAALGLQALAGSIAHQCLSMRNDEESARPFAARMVKQASSVMYGEHLAMHCALQNPQKAYSIINPIEGRNVRVTSVSPAGSFLSPALPQKAPQLLIRQRWLTVHSRVPGYALQAQYVSLLCWVRTKFCSVKRLQKSSTLIKLQGAVLCSVSSWRKEIDRRTPLSSPGTPNDQQGSTS